MARQKTRVTLQLSRDRPCASCEVQDYTIVPAHYAGFRQWMFGKGTGVKCNDIFTADLCMICHQDADSPKMKGDVAASEKFMWCILISLHRDWVDGRLIFVSGDCPDALRILARKTDVVASEEYLFDILMSLYRDLLKGRLVFK